MLAIIPSYLTFLPKAIFASQCGNYILLYHIGTQVYYIVYGNKQVGDYIQVQHVTNYFYSGIISLGHRIIQRLFSSS